MKRFFSRNLFSEGMRQLKVLGIISVVISVLISFFIVFGMDVSAKETTMYHMKYNAQHAESLEVPVIEEIEAVACVPVMLAAWMFVPLAVFCLFNFMNKRNSSDFYHGIVQKRETLCISFATAALVWTLIVMASSVLIAVVSTTLFPYVRFGKDFWPDLLDMSLAGMAISLFWIGIIVLSMSLSGNLITNLAVTAMILFFPKILYLVINAAVIENIDIYPYAYQDGILSGKYNLVTGVINNMFGYYDSGDILPSVIYTSVLGLILFALGCVAFCMRRSEAATQAAPTRKLQLIFRLIPAFVVTMVPCVYIFMMILGQEDPTESDYFMILLFYVIAVVTYFLYEVITTKKWRNILKSAPGLLILLLMDVVFVGAMFGRREMILAEQPQNSSYVRVLGTRMSDMNSNDYFQIRAAEVKITDEQAIRVLEENLSQNVSMIRSGEDYLSKDRTRYLVEFRDNGKSTYRLVFVRNSEAEFVNRAILTTKTLETLTDIPGLDVKGIVVGNLNADYETQMGLLQEYIDEVVAKPEKYATGILLGNDYYGGSEYMEDIAVTAKYKERTCQINLPIYYSMDFAEKYLETYNQKTAGQPMEQFFMDMDLDLETSKSVRVDVYAPSYGKYGEVTGYNRNFICNIEAYTYRNSSFNSEKRKSVEEMLQYLRSVDNGEILSDNGFIFVRYYSYDGIERSRYYPLTRKGMEIIQRLQENYD